MVQILASSNTYNFDFYTASFAYLNKFPNPYAKHVLSSDTIECYVDSDGRLRLTRLIVKRGMLPHFVKPFLGSSVDLWILEKLIIDPKTQNMQIYSANVDHRKVVKVEEYLMYSSKRSTTLIEGKIKISSNFIGLRKKIEEWSRNKLHSQMGNSTEALMYVTNKFKRPQKWLLA